MEQIFKILFIPTGEFVSQTGSSYTDSFSTTKKGRSWKRYCDVVIAMKTFIAKMRKHNNKVRTRGKVDGKKYVDIFSNNINDFVVKVYELSESETISIEDLEKEIDARNQKYLIKRKQLEYNNLAWRIKEFQKDIEANKLLLPSLQKELEKIKKATIK